MFLAQIKRILPKKFSQLGGNKEKGKGMESQTEVLKSVPSNLPALMRSYKVQQKASQVGFDWKDIDSVFEKVYEEINELRDVYKSKDVERINDELGMYYFP